MDWCFRHNRYRFASAMSSIMNKVSTMSIEPGFDVEDRNFRGKIRGVLFGSKGLTMATLRVFFSKPIS